MPRWLPIDQRFWFYVQKSDGCWLWTGVTNEEGYGRLRVNGKHRMAAQVGWELFHGKAWPDGKYACHTCDTPSCVRGDHVFPGTQADNMADCAAKGRIVAPRKTHCIRGHSLEDARMYKYRGKIQRLCRPCRAINMKSWRDANAII